MVHTFILHDESTQVAFPEKGFAIRFKYDVARNFPGQPYSTGGIEFPKDIVERERSNQGFDLKPCCRIGSHFALDEETGQKHVVIECTTGEHEVVFVPIAVIEAITRLETKVAF